MDWGNQGTRITGNIIYDTETANIFLEMDHGPILVDNNVVIGEGVRSNSEATVFAHNLFVDGEFAMIVDMRRSSQYYRPHTRIQVARKHGIHQDDMWFHNIFVRGGLDKVKQAPGYVSDHNVFLDGAQKSRFEGEHSVVDRSAIDLQRQDDPLGVTMRFQMSDACLRTSGPWVDSKLVGVFPTVGQTLEDRFGNPIRVDTDLNGAKRAEPVAGPLANPKQGLNTIRWTMRHVER